MTEEEKQKVLARLAASEIASLTAQDINSSQEDDKIKALTRLIRECNIPIAKVGFFYQKLIDHLQKSDLTINFYAYKFFNHTPTGRGYVNQFEGGNKWGGGDYLISRDDAEKKMFDFANSRNKIAHSDVINRALNLGKYDNNTNSTFQPSIRPKYAALNYARLRYGSCGQFGLSYVVLKEHLKHNATFLHSDSFDLKDIRNKPIHNSLANYINMQRLVVNMPPKMLEALIKSYRGDKFGNQTQVPGLGSTAYIEAQIHAGVQFDRDIKKLYIANSEIIECENKLKILHGKKEPFRVISSKQLREIFTKFSQKFGIPVEYV